MTTTKTTERNAAAHSTSNHTTPAAEPAVATELAPGAESVVVQTNTAVASAHMSPAGSPIQNAPLRIAVVGAGKMGQHHMRAIGRLGGLARLVGVADPAPGRGEELKAAGLDIPVYPDLATLLAREQVDVVHVCTNPETHLPVALEALEAGRHIYVEKPVAPTAAAAANLLARAAAAGVRVCAGHQLLYESPAREARRLLPALGEVVHLESYFSFRTVRWMAGGRVPLRADLQLLDILPHPVYLLLEFLREAIPDGEVALDAVRIGPRGTVHALVRRGRVTGDLVVTLDGRPVESYLRLVGTNGTIHADFVRGTVQRLLGPGTSGIDKAANPYRLARQLAVGTTTALLRRVLRRQYSYPGLEELFGAFYRAIREGGPSPVAEESILETVRICERIGEAMRERPVVAGGGVAALGEPAAARVSNSVGDDVVYTTPGVTSTAATPTAPSAPLICVTGGTGFLGAHVVRQLAAGGARVRCLARRTPPPWEQEPGVEYRHWDLGEPLPAGALEGVETVIHCAAATAGGWDEHRRNSIGAAEHLVQAAAAAGVRRIVHISSLAVLAEPERGRAVSEASPVLARSDRNGPYVWGKLESERLLLRRAAELGLEVRVIRPGAILDERHFEPPGRLGKRVGNLFVAVGSAGDRLGVVEVRFAASAVVWVARNFDAAPPVLHLLAPELPTRRELVARLRRTNPDLRVVWLPRPLLYPLSFLAVVLQKVLRPGRPAIEPARVFATQRYDNSLIVALAPAIRASGGAPAAPLRAAG